MKELALLLSMLEKANAATPAVVAAINLIRAGRAAGETDEQIQAKSMADALETRDMTKTDMGEQP